MTLAPLHGFRSFKEMVTTIGECCVIRKGLQQWMKQTVRTCARLFVDTLQLFLPAGSYENTDQVTVR